MKPEELTPPQRADFIHAYSDHDTFCRESLRIRDLNTSLVPLIQQAGQRKLTALIEKQRARKKPVRIVILKTRRSGFTVASCTHAFKRLVTWPGQKCTIIANSYKPAGLEAFGYLKGFYENYEPLSRHGASIAIPVATKDNEQQLVLENGSFVEVLSADGGEVRGGGRAFVLGDEVAFWRMAGKTLPGLLNQVPKVPNTEIIIQSTGNGVGGEFYELVQQARDPLNESGWEFLFFGWLEHEIYRMPVENQAKFQASLDAEEKLLMSMHGATLEQLAWRRDTIATECSKSVDMFHQEYPTTPEEAFLSSGRPYLEHKSLARQPIRAGISGELMVDTDPPRERVRFAEGDERGALTIFSRPERGRYYVLGADPSEGKDVSAAKRGADPDYSVGWMADADTGVQVALLRARIRPAAFADYLAQLAKFYNYAYLVPEANNAGFIDAIIRTNYPLQFIYNRRRDPGDLRSSSPQELGFETNGTTRNHLLVAFDDALRTGEITIASQVALTECYTFVIKPSGKAEGREGSHDDCVLAGALTVQGLRTAPKRKAAFEPEYRRKAVSGYGRQRRADDDD